MPESPRLAQISKEQTSRLLVCPCPWRNLLYLGRNSSSAGGPTDPSIAMQIFWSLRAALCPILHFIQWGKNVQRKMVTYSWSSHAIAILWSHDPLIWKLTHHFLFLEGPWAHHTSGQSEALRDTITLSFACLIISKTPKLISHWLWRGPGEIQFGSFDDAGHEHNVNSFIAISDKLLMQDKFFT